MSLTVLILTIKYKYGWFLLLLLFCFVFGSWNNLFVYNFYCGFKLVIYMALINTYLVSRRFWSNFKIIFECQIVNSILDLHIKIYKSTYWVSDSPELEYPPQKQSPLGQNLLFRKKCKTFRLILFCPGVSCVGTRS